MPLPGSLTERTIAPCHASCRVIDLLLVLYQLGGSINYAGAKAMVIGIKSDAIRDRVLAEVENTWL